MTKQALIINWKNVTMGRNAVPCGLSVHASEDAAYRYISAQAYQLDQKFLAPENRMSIIPVNAGTPLEALFSRKASVYFDEKSNDMAFRQAKALIPVERKRLDLHMAGLHQTALMLADSHVELHNASGFRSTPNWGAFAL